MSRPAQKTRVAIACGGTGGHLFPGIAVGRQLLERGASVTLIISPKEIDRCAAEAATGMEVVELPAVGLQTRQRLAFALGFVRSFLSARRLFRPDPPRAVLAMGGFTAAPPVLAGLRCGARAFLHESNTIPGRANRFLSRYVHKAFVGFSSTASLLPRCPAVFTGTPVRPEFQPREPGPCRAALGLDPQRPAVLVMGGSQGAAGVNRIVLEALPSLARDLPEAQWIHLAGTAGATEAQQAYSRLGIRALVRPFLDRMDLALNAAVAAVSRAGASSLAELAAVRLPSVLVPFPAAVDNHQYHNACAFLSTGAALLLEERDAARGRLREMLLLLARDVSRHAQMRAALAEWHTPSAASRIAELILASVPEAATRTAPAAAVRPPRGPEACRAIGVVPRSEPGGAA